MKLINIKVLASAFILSMSLCMISCGGNASSGDKKLEVNQEVNKSGKEYTSAYICPMHCEGSGSDKPGTCPVCNMDYVANKDYKGAAEHEGHNHEGHDHGHDHGHEGHDHSGHNH